MAIQQVTPITILLQGDGAASVFTFPIGDMFQFGISADMIYGVGVVPSSIAIVNPSVPVTSSTIDANGNITITFTSPLPVGDPLPFTVNLINDSGSAVSSSPIIARPVTGTFFQATQPVSGTVAVSNFPVTQPVSGSVTANQGGAPWSVIFSSPQHVINDASAAVIGHVIVDSAPTTAVTGTFFQAIQPVSGTVTANQGGAPWSVNFSVPQHVINDASAAVIGHVISDSGSVVNATLSAETTKVIGTVNQGTSPWVTSFSAPQHVIADASAAVIGHVISDSGSTTVVSSVTAALPAGTNVIGHVITDSGSVVNATLSAETVKVIGTVNQGTSPWVVGQATPASLQATVTPIAITKGVQGATGFTVQNLNDSGRTQLSFFVDNIVGVAAEALMTMSITKGAVAQTAATSYTVTAGKTLRLTSINFTVRSSTNAQQISQLRVRTAASAIAITSPIIFNFIGEAPATSTFNQNMTIAEGYEIAGGTQIAMSHIEIVTPASTLITVCLVGYEY